MRDGVGAGGQIGEAARGHKIGRRGGTPIFDAGFAHADIGEIQFDRRLPQKRRFFGARFDQIKTAIGARDGERHGRESVAAADVYDARLRRKLVARAQAIAQMAGAGGRVARGGEIVDAIPAREQAQKRFATALDFGF